MENVQSIVMYSAYSTYFGLLSMEERGRLISAIFDYAFNDRESEGLSPAAYMAYSFIRASLTATERNMKRPASSEGGTDRWVVAPQRQRLRQSHSPKRRQASIRTISLPLPSKAMKAEQDKFA